MLGGRREREGGVEGEAFEERTCDKKESVVDEISGVFEDGRKQEIKNEERLKGESGNDGVSN